MSYAVIHSFKGGTKQDYDAAVRAVHPPDGLPAGQTHHVAGPTDSGWTVFSAWDSRENWERFRDEILMPGLAELGDQGFPVPPEEIEYEIDAFVEPGVDTLVAD